MASTLKKIVKPLLAELACRMGPHRRKAIAPQLWILMYHRVLPTSDVRFASEEPGMLVEPDTLRMQIQEAKKYFELVQLDAWVAAKAAGAPLPAKACAITFDDGWLDNYQYAWPILQAEQAPATVFVVAEQIGTQFQFWPNIVAALLSRGQFSKFQQHPLFAAACADFSTAQQPLNREQLATFIGRLKQFSDRALYTALTELHWQQLIEPLAPALMSWPQLLEMQRSGLVTIGSHTCNHLRLNAALPAADLHHEIVDSQRLISQHTQVPTTLFCFPNGDFSPQALQLVEQHYQAAVTTRRGINSNQAALHQLTRIGLHEEVSASRRSFGARLSSWL